MQISELWVKIGARNDALKASLSEAEEATKKAAKRLEDSSKGLMKAVGVAATAASAAIAAIGVKSIEAAANSAALDAQFEQVFGNIQSSAQEVVNGLGEDFGMLPNRLKPAFSTMTSMFKGLGYDTEEAMNMAKDAVTLAADAAAFYDKSYEDANAALNSFLKGNYEGGEAIGLFGNETQIAAFAAEKLGISWKDAGEAQKQLARLEYAKAMQEAAGATGQAAREADSFQNQLGNLKQGWTDFMAIIGQPLLEPAVNALKGMTEHLTKLKDLVAAEGLAGAIEKIFPDWLEATIFAIAGAITVAMIPALIAMATAAWAAVAPLLPFLAAGAAIGALAYLIIKNWEPIKGFFINLWDGITSTATACWDALKDGIKVFTDTVTETWEGFKKKTSEIWNGIKDFFKKWGDELILIAAGPVGWSVLLGKKIAENWDNIKATASTAWNNVKTAITSPIESAKQTVLNIINSIRNAFANMRIEIPRPKLPKISVDWRSVGVGNAKVSIPDFNINWYKTGGIFNRPSIIGVGEAGTEAVIPLDKMPGLIADALRDAMGGNQLAMAGGITIQNMYVRNDQDIKLIARELYNLQQQNARGRGLK